MARNSAWMMAGQCASLLLQTAFFFILARLLGSRSYGIYVGAVAFCTIVSQYAANGAGTLYLRYVAVAPEQHPRYMGNILLSVLLLGTLVVAALSIAAPFLLNAESAALVLVVAVGECLCRQCTEAVARVFQTHEQMKATAALSLLTNALRFVVALGMLVFLHHARASAWAAASTAVSLAGCAVILIVAVRQFGAPAFKPRLLLQRFAEGFGFSFAGSTFSIYNDIDKTMLSHYGMNAADGLYTMAYRTIDMATMPSWSIYAVMLPGIFRAGHEDPRATRPLAGKMLRASLMLAVPLSGVLFLAAPAIPIIAGASFRGSVQAVRWLCVLPIMRSFQLSGGGALTGAGYQRYRTYGQLGAALGNFALNLYLIPRYGWLGAAWSSLATDGLIAALNWLLLFALTGKRVRTTLDAAGQAA